MTRSALMTNIDRAILEAQALVARRIGELDASDPDAVLTALGGAAVRVLSSYSIQGGHRVVNFLGANGREVSVMTSASGRQTATLYEAKEEQS